MEVCRVCGTETEKQNLIIALDDMFGTISFKEFLQYYCIFSLSNDKSLPQRACSNCMNCIKSFVYLVEKFENTQSRLLNHKNASVNIKVSESYQVICLDSSPERVDETADAKINYNFEPVQNDCAIEIKSEKIPMLGECQKDIETDKADNSTTDEDECPAKIRNSSNPNGESDNESYSLLVSVKTPEAVKKVQEKTKNWKKPMQRLKKLFAKELENPLETFVKLRAPENQICSDGEVKMQDVKYWSQMAFSCTHCRIKYESLDNLLKHLNAAVGPERNRKTIRCPECWGVFTRSQFLNHAPTHHQHLTFCCIYCSRIYKDMSSLLNHYVDQHPENDLVVFCLHCGYYTCNLQSMRMHKQVKHFNDYKKMVIRRRKAGKSSNTNKSLSGIKRVGIDESILETSDDLIGSKKKRDESQDETQNEPRRKLSECSGASSSSKSIRTCETSDSTAQSSVFSAKSDSSIRSSISDSSMNSIKRNRPCPLSKKPAASIEVRRDMAQWSSNHFSTPISTVKEPETQFSNYRQVDAMQKYFSQSFNSVKFEERSKNIEILDDMRINEAILDDFRSCVAAQRRIFSADIPEIQDTFKSPTQTGSTIVVRTQIN